MKPLNQPRRDLHIIVTNAHTIGVKSGRATGATVPETPFSRADIDKLASLGVDLLKNLVVKYQVEMPRLCTARELAMALCGVREEDVPIAEALPVYAPPSTRKHAQSDAVAKWADVTEETAAKMSNDEIKSKLLAHGVPFKSSWRKPELTKALLDAKKRATSTTSPSAATTWFDTFVKSRAPESDGHLHGYYGDEMNAVDNGDEYMAYLRPNTRLRGDAKRALVPDSCRISWAA